MSDPIRAYWFCTEQMTSPNAPRIKWKVGQTKTLKGGPINPCERGYHASPTLWDALKYAPGPMACLVELSGDVTPHGSPVDKYAARTRKLLAAVNIDRELRLFAADCAEHVLYIFERERPNDDRPRKAIQAARDFANGEVDDAARDASRAAARAAAWDAARAAAWAAARAAAWDTAWDAAWDAAWAAARDTSWDAAWDAARAAAWDTSWDAEQAWQREQFEQRFGHIFGEVAV